MPRACLAKTQTHHSNLCCTHTHTPVPAGLVLEQALLCQRSGWPRLLHPLALRQAAGPCHFLHSAPHLSPERWGLMTVSSGAGTSPGLGIEREKINSDAIKLSLLMPSAHGDMDAHC